MNRLLFHYRYISFKLSNQQGTVHPSVLDDYDREDRGLQSGCRCLKTGISPHSFTKLYKIVSCIRPVNMGTNVEHLISPAGNALILLDIVPIKSMQVPCF